VGARGKVGGGGAAGVVRAAPGGGEAAGVVRGAGGGGAADMADPARAAATLGRVAVVAVGAYNVGRISAAFDPAWNAPPGAPGAWVGNRPGARPETRRYVPPIPIAAGEEIMAFHLGSTVVLLLEPGVALQPALAPGQEVRVGQVLGRR